MIKKIIEWSNKKIKKLTLLDLKLLGWGCIFLGAFLSLSIVPIQKINAKYYLLLAILFCIKPYYKLIFAKNKKSKK